MKILSLLVASLLSLSLFSGSANARMPATDTGEFRFINQPLGLKVGVSAAGLGLIGLELWWFLLSKPKA